MWATIELFCQHHEKTIAALGVLGTFLAVITSLAVALLAQRANRTRLVAAARISVIVDPRTDGQRRRPRYLMVRITNTGILPLRIPLAFLHWRVPFRRTVYAMMPLDHAGGEVPQQKYPVEIAPRASHGFFVSEASAFASEIRRMIQEGEFGRLRLRMIRLRVATDDGATFRVKLDSAVRKELRNIK